MTVRITVGSGAAASLGGLQTAANRYEDLQQKLSTGKQIGRPSDDPAGAVSALALRADLRRNAQFIRNTSDATGWLTAADTAYAQATDLTQKVRTLTVQGLNTGASTGDSNRAIAEQINAIREAVLKIANSQYNGRAIFAGTADVAEPFDATGTYVGNEGIVQRSIGDKDTLTINQNGIQAFGANGDNLFDLMAELSSILAGDYDPDAAPADPDSLDTKLADGLARLDTALGELSSARAASGAALQRVRAAEQTQQTNNVTLRTHLSEIEDIDLAETVVAVNTANVVYQAALQTTANIRQLSLLNFLR